MRKKIIIFILICLSISLAYKAHSFYLKETQQGELEGRQLDNKKTWTKIYKDMTADQVKEALGAPERTTEGATIIWFYQKGGNVELYNDKVIKFTKPYTWDY